MSWYKTGTISINNGSTALAGAGTLWVDAGVLNGGDVALLPDGRLYEIASFQSNTGSTLASAYLGSNVSGGSYAIIPIGLLPSALAQQVKTVLTSANTALASAVLNTVQSMTVNEQAQARANIAALSAADVGKGYLAKSVAGNVDVTLNATEAANQFIELTGALTGNINVIVPAAARAFYIHNNTSGAYTLTVKTAAGTGIAVTQGKRVVLECDGTNVVSPLTSLPGALSVTGGIDSTAIGATTPSTGAFTTLSATGNVTLGDAVADAHTVYGLTTFHAAATAQAIAIRGRSSDNASELLFKSQDGATKYASLLAAPTYLAVEIGGGEVSRFTTTGQGLGVAPSAWNSIFRALDLYGGGALAGSSNAVSLFSNVYYNGSDYIYKATAAASRYLQGGGQHTWYVAPSGTAAAAASFVQLMQTVSTATTSGANAAASVLSLYKDTGTSRSINAAGTINASGADAAEYEFKGSICGVVAKGQIVGRDAEGKLTDRWSLAFSKGIKSTDPHLVGGDVWGSEDKVGKRPEAPQLLLPEYAGTPHPGEPPAEPVLPSLELPSAPQQQPDEADDTFAVRTAAWQEQCAALTAAHDAAVAQYQDVYVAWLSAATSYDAALAQYNLDQQDHAAQIAAAQAGHEAAVALYQAALASFEATLEAERAKVDRIAYSGRVPVNVLGAAPGDYIVAAEGPDDSIIGTVVTPAQMRADMPQMLDAVGRVHRLLDDGRALVAVIVL